MSISKILVIGAGIGGLAVCYWLKRFGFSPVLIEKSASLRKGGQALDVRGVATLLTREMGIENEIKQMRTRIECGRHVNTQGKVLHEEYGERFGFRQDDEIEILSGDLISILMKTISGVPIYFNQSIQHLEQNEEGVSVHYSDGKAEHYDIVIAADGIHSATRRMVFDPSEYQLIRLGAYLSTFSVPNYLKLSHTELACESNDKLLMINSDHDPKLARAAFMFRSQKIVKDIRDENEQKQCLRDAFHDFGWEANAILNFMDQSDDFYFDAITQVKMDHFTKARIALLGDAAYCASPLSSQGNNLALVGAYVLAGELKAAHGDYKTAFNRYTELLHPFVKANQAFGAWVSESYFIKEEVSKAVAEERTQKVLSMMKTASNAIILPRY